MTLIRKVAILLMVVVMVAAALPVWAQGSLSAEEEALVERLVTVFAAADAFDSYQDDTIEEQLQNLIISTGGSVVQEQKQVIMTTSTSTIDRANNTAARLVKKETTEGDILSVIEGELRFVDETLYATAVYTEGEGYSVFPEGWTVIEDPEGDFVFSDLEPQDLLDSLSGDMENPFEDLELLQSVISEISVADGEWEGTPAEVISAKISGDGIISILASQDETFDPESEMGVLFDYMDEDSGAEMVLYVGENDTPIHAALSMQLNITDLDISLVDPNAPPGFLVTMNIVVSQRSTLSQVNAVSTAITAP